jgi:hypothetical protein
VPGYKNPSELPIISDTIRRIGPEELRDRCPTSDPRHD